MSKKTRDERIDKYMEQQRLAMMQSQQYYGGKWPGNYNGTPFQQVAQSLDPGVSGNVGQNLNELNEVRDELRRRHANRPETFVQITDRNETRLFKPLLPVNRYVHEDDHIEWLYGRTRAVCRKLAWSKSN